MKPTHPYPSLRTTTDGTSTLSHAGGPLLTETIRATGLGQAISAHLVRWRKPRALHDPGKICTDLAIALALGGDCLADAALLRNQPDLYGPVASDPTISPAPSPPWPPSQTRPSPRSAPPAPPHASACGTWPGIPHPPGKRAG